MNLLVAFMFVSIGFGLYGDRWLRHRQVPIVVAAGVVALLYFFFQSRFL